MSEYVPFLNRWRITGTLRTTAPLHIGSGFAVEDRIARMEGKARQVQTVCLDANGRPFIPATSLKGPLRAWIAKRDEPLARELFGSIKDDSHGGVIAFWDARLKVGSDDLPAFVDEQGCSIAQPANLPYWNAARGTAVSVSVAIDRATRTAAEHQLFHVEYVPAGAEFEVELTAQKVDEPDIARLLGALTQFGKDDSLTLGAHQVHGWGRVAWTAEPQVFICEKPDVEAWLKNPTTQGFGVATRAKVVAAQVPGTAPAPPLTITIELSFSSPLLVRDPQQKESAAAEKERLKAAGKQQKARKQQSDAAPLVAADGKPLIPARAVRGVLRSRAEMILRTIGKDVPHQPPSVKSLDDVKKADLATRLFGASGWRAPLTVSDFTTGDAWERLPQEFIAIDRFTGGGAEGLKFDSVAAIGKAGAPLNFTGALTLDLARFESAGTRDEALAILALVLRDLCEGDLTFGSGASKGYGACTAKINGTDFATWASQQTINLATLHA